MSSEDEDGRPRVDTPEAAHEDPTATDVTVQGIDWRARVMAQADAARLRREQRAAQRQALTAARAAGLRRRHEQKTRYRS